MLTRNNGDIEFSCDDCGEVLETDSGDFYDALDTLRAAKWRSSKDDETQEWTHQCHSCHESFRGVGRRAAHNIMGRRK
jgi:hypothetical protein